MRQSQGEGTLELSETNATFVLYWTSSNGKVVSDEVIEVDRQDVLLRDIIKKCLPKKALPSRDFRDAFYDLDRATTEVQDEANFRLIRNILELQKKNANLRLYYFSSQYLPKGRVIASVKLQDKNTAHMQVKRKSLAV